MKFVFACRYLVMDYRIADDLPFGYLGFMDFMVLIQVIGFLVILNFLLALFFPVKFLFPGQVLPRGFFWEQLHCLLF